MDNREGFFMRNFIRITAVAALICFTSHAAIAAQTKEATRTRDAYAPFEELIAITPSSATIFTPPLRGCIVEAAGDLEIATIKGDSNVVITVVAGQLIPALITEVSEVGTTATVVCGR